ncbi:MAG: Ldh family oxidoreductase [Alphaproteobacteria bacterium]|nr:Ldh family oxidoreductase [Alphaproteobacteria bacterium]
MSSVRHDSNGSVYVQVEPLKALVSETFTRNGCSRTESDRIATRLSGANLRGHDSHGVIRVPRYANWLNDGVQVADVTVDVTLDNEMLAVIDGKFGFGQTVGEQTVDIGIQKAGKHGVAITALQNAGHLGRIGDWAERAAAEGLVSIHMVNVRGSLIVAPFGGIDRRMSTSPFCAGIPMNNGEDPIILDMATSVVAEGKALVALKGGKPLPGDSIITEGGVVTGDPRPLYGDVPQGDFPDPSKGPGALRAFGDHKGSGLNFLMEMMAGALTGSGCAGALNEPKRRFCNGMFSIYLSPDAFGHSDDSFVSEVRSYVEFLKSSRPTEPGGEVLIPGEKEKQVMAERLVSGLPLAPEAWSDIVDTARNASMHESEIEVILGGKP